LAQGLKKDVGGRFRYAVGLQSWVNGQESRGLGASQIFLAGIVAMNLVNAT